MRLQTASFISRPTAPIVIVLLNVGDAFSVVESGEWWAFWCWLRPAVHRMGHGASSAGGSSVSTPLEMRFEVMAKQLKGAAGSCARATLSASDSLENQDVLTALHPFFRGISYFNVVLASFAPCTPPKRPTRRGCF